MVKSRFDSPMPLLANRATAAELLACSTSKVIRLEREGALTPIRLGRSPTAQVHYRLDEIAALATGGSDDR